MQDLIAYYVYLCYDSGTCRKTTLKIMKAYVPGFIIKIKEIKDNSDFYEGYVDQEDFVIMTVI